MEINFEAKFSKEQREFSVNLDEYTLLHGEIMVCSLLAYVAEHVVSIFVNLNESEKLDPNDDPVTGIDFNIKCEFSSDRSVDFVKTNLKEIHFSSKQQEVNFLTDFLAFIYQCCKALEAKSNKTAS